MNVGTYELVGRVSAGRHGAVWKGRDPQLNRDAALKQVRSPSSETAQALRTEAATMAGLDHPNIVRAYDLLESEGDLWLIEEWIDGADLATVSSESGRLSPAQTLGVVRGALEGLAYAHEHGVVHGDVAPANILVGVDGTSKLTDFGLAGRPGGPSGGGTPGFASPEAMSGAPLAPTMDVYAAAAVIAAVLRGDSLVDPTAGSTVGSADPLRGVPGGIEPVLAVAMAADPTRRYPDAAALLAAFDEAADRTLGAGWWTTAGVGAAAAAATSGGLAAVGAGATAGATAGAGAVGIETAAGSGPVAAVTTAQIAGTGTKIATRSARVPLIAAGAAVTALVVVVGGFAVVRHNSGPSAGPAAGPSTVAVDTDYHDPSGAPTPSPSATPTDPADGFTGSYHYVSVVVSSTDPGEKVGKKYTSTWTVRTTCDPRCSTAVKPPKGAGFTFSERGGQWTYNSVDKVDCVNRDTGKPDGTHVKFRDQARLSPSKIVDGVVSQMTGTDRYRQLQLCNHQESARYDTKYKLTLTLTKK